VDVVWRWFWSWLFGRAAKREINGIDVGILWREEEVHDCAFRKITAALDLIELHDPRSLMRLRAHADGILVFGRGDYLGKWVSQARLIVLKEAYATSPSTEPAELASTLVHEGTHAWLDSRGLPYTADRRARMEAICFRNELAFARRLPEPGELISRVNRQLARDPEYWTDREIRQRAASHLRELGVPGWLVHFIGWLARQRTA
jgi:hypothetical protein